VDRGIEYGPGFVYSIQVTMICDSQNTAFT